MKKVVLATAAALAALASPALAGSLPSVTSGHRPGPDALYLPPAVAPQLQNSAPWKADPILISGAQAYRDGEYLYQDYLYDDHGATGTPDPNNPIGPNADLYSPPAGTLTYPTDPVYGDNAADLVEFRVKPLDDSTAIRVTLNTLKDAAKTGFTVAIGTSPSAVAWPHGAGVSSPAQMFLTVHGSSAELTDAATGKALSPAPTVSTDMTSRQVDVRIPHAAWNPGSSTVRMEIGVGLWDTASNAYLAPSPGSASATTPGGASPLGAALFNVGPRFNEPLPDITAVPTYDMADSAVGGMYQAAWWREKAQATALATGDISEFHADVDFGKLAAGATDNSGVPKTGTMNRILASHYSFGQGYDNSKVCYDLASSFSAGAKCIGRMVGQLQPYTIYVPKKPQPANGYGMTLLLHSLSANYNQYTNSKNQSQLGERGPGSIVITPAGRGPDGFYAGIAEADTFEVWADVARHYKLDPDWTVVSGYSMGGFGTYRLLARYPDLFARGFSVVGIPGTVNDQLASLRNTPIMAWNSGADELVQINESEQAVKDLTAAGLRFTEDLFPAADHLTLATNDEYGKGADWLGTFKVDRNPPHVTFVVDPTEDSSDAASVADHAYWASGLTVRDPKANPDGTFDARSEAFGVGDGKPTGVSDGAGTLNGGAHGPTPYIERSQDWTPAPKTPVSDTLDVNATNIATATVDAARARLSCAPTLNVKTDGPLDLQVDCTKVAAGARSASGACSRRVAFSLPRVKGLRVTNIVVTRGKSVLLHRRGHNIRTLTLSRPARGYRVRVTMTTSAPGKRVTLIRKLSSC
jgi:pimeloyl-ACP methyl ester carboxylesterase